MSREEAPEPDCSAVLDQLYEYLDSEMPVQDREKVQLHIDECSPCLEEYGLEQSVRQLVKRCCGHDEVPTDLRDKVLNRISEIRAGQRSATEDGPEEAAR